jgi:hypothetical protein
LERVSFLGKKHEGMSPTATCQQQPTPLQVASVLLGNSGGAPFPSQLTNLERMWGDAFARTFANKQNNILENNTTADILDPTYLRTTRLPTYLRTTRLPTYLRKTGIPTNFKTTGQHSKYQHT